MKKSINIIFALFILTVSSLFYMSCDIKSPTEGLKVIVNTTSRQTAVAVNISDRNGLSVTSPVTIRFTGPDSANVIDEVNNKITTRNTTAGAFTFSIKDGVAISESSPVRLVLQVRSDKKDYLDVDYPVTLTTSGFQNLNIKMIKVDSLKASGVDQANNIPTNATSDPKTGAINTPISVSTPTGAVVSIPQGAVLKDASGSPLGGNINVSVTTYSSQAAALLPSHEVSINNNNLLSAVAFTFQVTDQNGRSAATFGNTDSKIYLPLGNVVNLATNKLFQAGDKGEFYFVDPNGTSHSLGQSAVVSNSASGRITSKASNPSMSGSSIQVAFDLNSLQPIINVLKQLFPNMTLEQLFTIATQQIQFAVIVMPYTYTFDFGSNFNPHNVSLALNLSLKSGKNTTLDIRNSTLQYVTADPPVSAVVVMAGAIGGDMAVSSVLNNPVSSNKGQNSLPVTYAGLSYFDIFVQGKCPNDNTKLINPNVVVNIKKDSTPYGNINLSNGRAGTYIKDGAYTLTGTYNKETYSTTATISNGSVSISTNSNCVPMADAGGSNVHYYIMTTEACK